MNRRPRTLELLLAATCLVFTGGTATAQSTNFTAGKRHWLASRYPQAMPPLKIARAEPNGRNAEVDYMLGTSGCRIAAQRRWGARVLNFALYSYPLTAASRATITAERDRCLQPGPVGPLVAAARIAVDTAVVAGATARGKLFNFGDRGIASYPARRTRELSLAELTQRQVPVGQAERIAAVLRRSAPPGARVAVIGRYAIVTSAGQSDAELQRMSAQLDRYVDFLAQEYEFTLPDRYITLYLMPDIRSLRAIADKVHGLDVSPSTLGYSFQDDLSAVGVIHGTQSGTLMHELFHLLVRANFGDIPQWLDEGIASLYEVSAEQGDRYVGLPNWRGRVLDNAWDLRPSISDVVASPWFAFDRVDGDGGGFMVPDERAAVHLATARYLTLYLQERGALRRIFAAFRARDPGEADDPGRAGVAIVEQGIGKVAEAQRSYDEWLREVVRRDETNAPDTPGRTIPGKTLPNNVNVNATKG
jgi:hypothetical protein